MAILLNLVKKHSIPFYSIVVDDTTDSSNREQIVICFRWVDNSLNAHEEFIGLQQVDRIDAATITIHNLRRPSAHEYPVNKSNKTVL